MMKAPKPKKAYRHTGTGEIIYIVDIVRNHFHNCKVAVYESSFSAAEYHYIPVKSDHWKFFEPCEIDDLRAHFAKYKTAFNKLPIFRAIDIEKQI